MSNLASRITYAFYKLRREGVAVRSGDRLITAKTLFSIDGRRVGGIEIIRAADELEMADYTPQQLKPWPDLPCDAFKDVTGGIHG